MARVSTDAIPVEQDEAAVAEPEQVQELAENELKLSDGRVVVLKETTGLDDDRIERQLAAMGYQAQGVADSARFGRAKAVMTIVSIGGVKQAPIRTKDELHAVLMTLKSRDVNAIVVRWAALNGLAGDSETFRGNVG